METYSFLLTFIAIILGVAVAKALEGLGWPFKRHPAQTNTDTQQMAAGAGFYLPHTLGLGLIILMITQFWWGIFDGREIQDLSFLSFLQFLLTPLLYYFMADVITPYPEETDLKAHYWRQVKPALILAALALFNNMATDFVGPEGSTDNVQQGTRAAAIAVLLVLAFSKRPWVHYAGYTFFYAAMAFFIMVATPTIG